MDANDYIRKVIDLVLELTGVGLEELMSGCRKSEVVDARWLIVRVVWDAGYYTAHIARAMHLSIRQVQAIVGLFDQRTRKADPSLRQNYEITTRQLRGN